MKDSTRAHVRRPAAGAAAVMLCLLCGVPRASGGEIRGTVRIAAPSASSTTTKFSPYPGQVSALAATSRPSAAETAGDAVVYVVPKPGASSKGAPAGGPQPELRQRGQSFVPRVLAIRTGTTVTFPNEDPFYHNVFSYSSTKRFDLGRYGSGKSRDVRFDKPGLVKVFCEIHSDMAAYILVLDTDAFARAGADGRFALPALPAGVYEVKAWHPDRPEWSSTVTVPSEGAVDLDIAM